MMQARQGTLSPRSPYIPSIAAIYSHLHFVFFHIQRFIFLCFLITRHLQEVRDLTNIRFHWLGCLL